MHKLRLDRTGGLAACIAAVATLTLPAAAQPANDTCTTAIDVAPGASIGGTTVGANADGASLCGDFVGIPDVYYNFTAPTAGAYQFDTNGSTSTGNVIILFDSCPTDPFGFRLQLGCDGGSGVGGQAQIRHLLSAGEFISIAVANPDAAGQPFTFNVTGPLPPPANDECSGAYTVDEGVPFFGDSTGATTSMMFDEQTDCNSTRGAFAVGADDVFLSFTPSASGFYDIASCGSTYNTVLSIHDGCPATPANSIACFDDAPAGGCSDEFGDDDSFLPGVALQGGVTYTLRVAGFADRDYFNQDPPAIVGGQQGAYQILVTPSFEQPNPPANDLCENAEPLLVDQFVPGSNVYATGVSGPCTDPAFGDPFDVWYSFTAPTAGENLYVFEVISDSEITRPEMTLAFYETCGGPALTCLTSNFFLAPVPRREAIALSQGETILLRVGETQGYQSGFIVNVFNAGPPAANTSCDTALAVSAGSSTVVDPSQAVTTLPSDCPGANFDINPLWYSFTAPETAYYDIGAGVEIDLPTSLAIYDACNLPATTCAGDFFSPASAQVHLDAGQTILMRVAPNAAGTNSFDLTVSTPIFPPPPPANDDCANAVAMTAFPFTDSVAFGGAAGDLDTDCNDPSLAASGAGVWYTMTPDDELLVEPTIIATDPANQAIVVSVFQGDCGTLAPAGCIDFAFGGASSIVVEPGNTYFFLVHFRDTLTPGLVTADITFDATPVPENDACENAAQVTETDADIVIDTAAATADGDSACTGFDGIAHKSVWYTFTTGTAGDLNVHDDLTMGFVDGSFMALFTGDCGALSEVICATNPGSFFPGPQYDLASPLAAGATYHLLVGSRSFPAPLVHHLTFSYTGTFAGGCAADLDGNQAVDVFDLLAYLDGWFVSDPAADIDGTPGVDVFDLLAYLDGWFAGC